jgi:hypothetical protein
MIGIEQRYQHFELVGTDRICQETDGIADAAFNGSRHFQLRADDLTLV